MQMRSPWSCDASRSGSKQFETAIRRIQRAESMRPVRTQMYLSATCHRRIRQTVSLQMKKRSAVTNMTIRQGDELSAPIPSSSAFRYRRCGILYGKLSFPKAISAITGRCYLPAALSAHFKAKFGSGDKEHLSVQRRRYCDDCE